MFICLYLHGSFVDFIKLENNVGAKINRYAAFGSPFLPLRCRHKYFVVWSPLITQNSRGFNKFLTQSIKSSPKPSHHKTKLREYII